MASSGPVTTHDIRQQLQQADIKSLVKSLVSRRLRTGDLTAIQVVLLRLPDNSGRLKAAIIYLESANWNQHDALLHLELDTADREGSWVLEGHDGRPGTLQLQNPDFKRVFARAGEAFEEELFTFVYRTAGGNTVTVSLSEAAKQGFDKNDQNAVDDLNRWRRGNIWRTIGPEVATTQTLVEKWHPLQETYVRNRFSNSTGAKPDFRQIFKDYVSVFDGVYLPGRVVPCGTRTQSAITSYLHRECISKINGVPAPKSLTKDLLQMMARNAIRDGWKERVGGATESGGQLIYGD